MRFLLSFIFIFIASFSFSQKQKTDTLKLDISAYKYITFTDTSKVSNYPVLPVKELATGQNVYASYPYWYALSLFIKTSKNGNYSATDLENLQSPFIRYALDYENYLRQQRKDE